MNDLPDDVKKHLYHLGGTEESVMGKPTPPQMPDVIYINPEDGPWPPNPLAKHMVPYTRTDLCDELKAAVNNFLAEGRPHGGRNTQFPDGCECNLCENWDKLNREATKAQGLLR